MPIVQTWNLGKSLPTGKNFYCWMLNRHAMPIKLPQNIDVYTHTLMPIVYIVLVNAHVLFELTAKQALEARTISDISMSVSSCLPKPLSGDGLTSFTHFQRRKRTASILRVKPPCSWDEPWDLSLPKKGYYCLSHDIKLPAVGKRVQKFNPQKLIYREKTLPGIAASSATIIGFWWTCVPDMIIFDDTIPVCHCLFFYLEALTKLPLCSTQDSHREFQLAALKRDFLIWFLLDILKAWVDVLLSICLSATWYLFFYFGSLHNEPTH